ncbi:MAG: zinc-dependent peptidase [Ignavibacteriaceae bacterium]|nr:zinc-dependent peptidase [Ignavibacteriaceae bacterium]
MFGLKKRRREKLRNKELKPEWKEIIIKNIKFYSLLSEEMKKELHGLIQIFMDEKTFEGCEGLELTDKIKITIASQACILLLGRKSDIYPTLRTILVYPHAYFAPLKQRMEDGSIIEGYQARLGESWSRGQVVLAWDEILQDTNDIHDGHNLVLHEFAHQLDNESGAAEGIPEFDKRSSYIVWARVLTNEYNKLISDIVHQKHPLLDQYGATNPAEFFAVATEYFFERPIELKNLHSELYEQFKNFFKLDTAAMILTVKNQKNEGNVKLL